MLGLESVWVKGAGCRAFSYGGLGAHELVSRTV